jgi:hypothetical protein
MHVADAHEKLLSLLHDEGQEPESLEPVPAWRAFRRFMSVPATGVEEDALLYEYITAAFGGPRRFVLSLCRQFDVDDAGEQALIQLRCEFMYEPTPALEALGAYNQWWSAGNGGHEVSEALDAIERRPEWSVIAEHDPVESTVYQERAC